MRIKEENWQSLKDSHKEILIKLIDERNERRINEKSTSAKAL